VAIVPTACEPNLVAKLAICMFRFLDTILALDASIQTDVPYTGRICNESRFTSQPTEAVPTQLVVKLLTLFVLTT